MLTDEQVEVASIVLNYVNRQQLLRLHYNMQKRAFFPAFNGKVDYINSGLPNYTDTVKQPVCLSKVRDNIIFQQYLFLIDYLRDIVLMYNNCVNFVKQSGAANIYEWAEEMIYFITSSLIQIFRLRLSHVQLLEIGANLQFRCIVAFRYEVDVLDLHHLVASLNQQDQSFIAKKYGTAFEQLSCEHVIELEKDIMLKVYAKY